MIVQADQVTGTDSPDCSRGLRSRERTARTLCHYASGMSSWEIPPADPSDVYLNRIRELESEAHNRITNQHVVSKVILKGFGAPGPGGTGWQLTPFDLRLCHELQPPGLGGCGKLTSSNSLRNRLSSSGRAWRTISIPPLGLHGQ